MKMKFVTVILDKANIASIFNISRAAISNWGEVVPVKRRKALKKAIRQRKREIDRAYKHLFK